MENQKNYILSIYFGLHDTCITIASEKEILLHLEAERIFRKKHICLNKKQMVTLIKIALDYLNINISDIGEIYFDASSIDKFGGITKINLDKIITRDKENGFSKEKMFNIMGNLRYQADLKDKINLLGKRFDSIISFHHDNHIGTGLVSGYKDAIIVCADGGSEDGTTKVYLKKKGKITLLEDLDRKVTSGLFYGNLTQLIIHPEILQAHTHYAGKTMGLAAYGKFNLRLFNLIKDNKELLLTYSKKNNIKLKKLLNLSNSYKKPWLDKRRIDLAYNGQKFWEEEFIKLFKKYRKYSQNLIFVGGAALNVQLNSKIIESKIFKNVYITPVSGDSGQSLGAILYHHPKIKCNYPFLGRSFGEATYSKELIDSVVKDLLNHKIIAWYQGRSEIGPRALGHRSFIGLPDSIEMKNKLSIIVKKREPYRPVAPIIIEEERGKYFDIKEKSPYMTFSPKVKSITKEKAPAIVHIDKTSRVQTISKKDNLILYEVLKKLKNYGKPPIIMNSSFNVNKEAIVDTPKDAIKCFKRSKADVLYINGRRFEKKERRTKIRLRQFFKNFS